MKFFKTVLSYIVSLSSPKALADAVNAAASPDELDERVVQIAGLDYGRRKKISDAASSENPA